MQLLLILKPRSFTEELGVDEPTDFVLWCINRLLAAYVEYFNHWQRLDWPTFLEQWLEDYLSDTYIEPDRPTSMMVFDHQGNPNTINWHLRSAEIIERVLDLFGTDFLEIIQKQVIQAGNLITSLKCIEVDKYKMVTKLVMRSQT
ncbi:hypothetical protein [Pseudomonas aeruginosa]|uniref:hypothetical protein n=1 Tax=Pseudomonas aeruginosa TaxID=287 RepID=UPI001CA57C6F|nr:hypothetical protein [Pseudomonas aeruginosa]MBW6066046.1 hypothetical protein [Pseudomonas aeruginosa]USL86643.1 hypothetical protein CDGHABPJ_00185 [Pseudomonas phage OMKO1]WNV47728.1 hypothetical protein [Pseudomonas phage fMGyn-Pae01]